MEFWLTSNLLHGQGWPSICDPSVSHFLHVVIQHMSVCWLYVVLGVDPFPLPQKAVM